MNDYPAAVYAFIFCAGVLLVALLLLAGKPRWPK